MNIVDESQLEDKRDEPALSKKSKDGQTAQNQQYAPEESSALEQVNWPPSVQSSCMRPSKPSPLKLSNRGGSSASKKQRGKDDDHNSEKNYELREFEKIEQSISESSVFDLDTSLKTRRESSQCDRISPLNSIHNK